MLEIEISYRHYNGDYGIGSIFEEKYCFKIEKNLCISDSTKVFCNNDNLGSNLLSNVRVSMPFVLKENNLKRLNDIIKNIQTNNNYLYDKIHYDNDTFNFNRYDYIDVIIDGISYEINNQDDIVNEVRSLIKINKIDEILDRMIKEVIFIGSDDNE